MPVAAIHAAWKGADHRGEAFDVGIGCKDRPAGRILRHFVLRPDRHIDCNSLLRTGTDRLAHCGITEGRGDAAQLQGKFVLIDTAGGVDGEDQFEIDDLVLGIDGRDREHGTA